jgi:hypothetical protein
VGAGFGMTDAAGGFLLGGCWAALDMGNKGRIPGSPPVTASKSQCLLWGNPN